MRKRRDGSLFWRALATFPLMVINVPLDTEGIEKNDYRLFYITGKGKQPSSFRLLPQ